MHWTGGHVLWLFSIGIAPSRYLFPGGNRTICFFVLCFFVCYFALLFVCFCLLECFTAFFAGKGGGIRVFVIRVWKGGGGSCLFVSVFV